ncbi:MAG: HNH endonuclease signature motif containing protein [Dehalococcoidia bacterium]|nr:HNH endonuclease signature motif containing protein [Dehalococcoidia bacterium]
MKLCACGCGLPVSERHGSKWKRGHTRVGTALERFLAKILPTPNGCWEWSGGHTGFNGGYGGYALISIKTDVGWKSYLAHRFSYETFVGLIPEGKELDHICRNHGCVNYEHVEPVTHSVNVLRGDSPAILAAQNQAITHCPKGHPYDEENTVFVKNGARRCGACHREEWRRWRDNPGIREREKERHRNRRLKIKLEGG